MKGNEKAFENRNVYIALITVCEKIHSEKLLGKSEVENMCFKFSLHNSTIEYRPGHTAGINIYFSSTVNVLK